MTVSKDRSMNSSFGIFYFLYFSGARAGRPGFNSRQGQEIFLYSTASRPALGLTQPPVQWMPGALSPGVKLPGREADPSPPSNTEVKNGGAIPLLFHMSSWHSV
jgi:hypothetical protein